MNEEKFNARNGFAESVDQYTREEDVKADDNRKSRIPALLLQSVMIAICIAIAGYCVMTIVSGIITTRRNESEYDLIRGEGTSVLRRPGLTPEPNSMLSLAAMMGSYGYEYKDYVDEVVSEDDIQRRYATYRNFLYLKSQLSDVYGWIYVDDTRIDYPIMKDDDNTFYINHNFRGYESSAGSIFVDANLSDNFEDNVNNIIYGHCMKDGTMFRTLKSFLEQANKNLLARTMRIEIYTEKGIYVFKILSAYRDNQFTFDKVYYEDDADYLKYLDRAAAMNFLSVSQPYDVNSRICTLVTCANVNSNRNERYVMHGIMTSFIPASSI